MDHPQGEIPINLSSYDIFMVILNDKVLYYEDNPSFENKGWGNEYLAKQVFTHFLQYHQLPEIFDDRTLRQLIINYARNWHYDLSHLTETDRLIDPEESNFLVYNHLFKDIVGTWGPTNWSFYRGVHLGITMRPENYVIDRVVVENQSKNTNIILSPDEMFTLTLNLLFLSQQWPFNTNLVQYLVQQVNSETNKFDDLKDALHNLEPVLQSISEPRRRYLGYKDEEVKLYGSRDKLMAWYFMIMWNLLTEDKVNVWEILRNNGIQLLCQLSYHDRVLEFLNEILIKREFLSTLEMKWLYLIHNYLSLLQYFPKIMSYTSNYGIDEGQIQKLEDFLRNSLTFLEFTKIPGWELQEKY